MATTLSGILQFCPSFMLLLLACITYISFVKASGVFHGHVGIILEGGNETGTGPSYEMDENNLDNTIPRFPEFNWFLSSPEYGCRGGYCWSNCMAVDPGHEWCYTTKTFSQSYDYVKCSKDSDCLPLWKCGGPCTITKPWEDDPKGIKWPDSGCFGKQCWRRCSTEAEFKFFWVEYCFANNVSDADPKSCRHNWECQDLKCVGRCDVA